jgi:hypothetical protein
MEFVVRQLRVFPYYGAPLLTRGRGCLLFQLETVVVSALPVRTRMFRFLRLT